MTGILCVSGAGRDPGPRRDELALAAALGVAAATARGNARPVAVLDLRQRRPPRRGLLASEPAAELEAEIAARAPHLRAAARGHLCFVAPPAGTDPPAAVGALSSAAPGALLVVACAPGALRAVLASDQRPAAAVLLADRARRSLLALLSRELHAEGVLVKAWPRPPGRIAGRRALAGLEPGGESARRAARHAALLAPPPAQAPGPAAAGFAALGSQAGQALPAVVGFAAVIVALALALAAIGGATTAKGRIHRAADLAALAAARSMRDDFPRLFLAARRPDGSPNPAHLPRERYLERARRAAIETGVGNGLRADRLTVSFRGADSIAPVRVRVGAAAAVALPGAGRGRVPVRARAQAALSPPAPAPVGPERASGGGYSGTLAYRQGKPMRPDVAAAFDRMAAAAGRAGHALVVNSAFRSDAEQSRLFAQNPDPRWVAPPGRSLHRCGTELDLGPAATHGWLAANSRRFGFVRRYPWEPWHFGFADGPEPCSAAGDRAAGAAGGRGGDGRLAGGSLPGFVPVRFRRPLAEAAARHDVSAALLAAQLLAESNFNPAAVSPAGARGIAQFMPATAAAYGLRDPFDPAAAIAAQARLMADLLARFGSVQLALAAYNAGPALVETCGCVPPYAETEAYVARIVGLLDGAGELSTPAPLLAVRLVE